MIEDGKVRKEAGYTTDLWTRSGVEFIEQNKDRPFFLFLAYNGPVLARQPDAQPGAQPPRGLLRGQAASQLSRATRCIPGSSPTSSSTIRSPRCAAYAAETSGVDDGVGEIMATLERLDLDDNTLVVYAADQGWMGGQNGMWGMGDHTSAPSARTS